MVNERPNRGPGGNKRGSKHCSIAKKAEIIEICKGGAEFRATGEKFGVPPSTISGWMKRVNAGESHERKKGSGCPRKATPQPLEDENVVVVVIDTSEITHTEIVDSKKKRVSNRNQTPVAEETVTTASVTAKYPKKKSVVS